MTSPSEPVESREQPRGVEQRWPAVTSWDDEHACHGAHQVQAGHWTMEPHHFGRCHSDAAAYLQDSLAAALAEVSRLREQGEAIRAVCAEPCRGMGCTGNDDGHIDPDDILAILEAK